MRNMSVADLPLQFDREKIAEFCRARGIRKLSLFGSVLRDDFDPARSDVDVLAEFESDALKGVGFRYFGYGQELAAILGRKVDFCSRLNQYIEAAVRREAIPIYERACGFCFWGARAPSRAAVAPRGPRQKRPAIQIRLP